MSSSSSEFREQLLERLEDDCPPGLPDTWVGAYRYRDSSFEIVHWTSVPLNHEEAVSYFEFVYGNFGGVLVERLPPGGGAAVPLPYKYNPETKEVESLGSAAGS